MMAVYWGGVKGGMMNTKIELLRPDARPYFEKFLSRLDRAGYLYAVLETLRTQAVQNAYYAQGRETLAVINALRKEAGLYLVGEAEAKRIVTHTLHSVHMDGGAADIVPVVDGKIPWTITAQTSGLWLAFGRLGQESGLEWGGTWKPLDKFGIGWDAPHYQRARAA
jgi:peptidoglycan L-alanyl-D-glutamate endopeptidase CwlK